MPTTLPASSGALLMDPTDRPSAPERPADLQLGRWIVEAKRGSVEAFEELVSLHERQVFGTAWRLLGRVEDAQDAAQEVFLRLYRSISRLDPSRPLAPWLYRVTVNVCRDLGRRRRHPDRTGSTSLDALRIEHGLEVEDLAAGPDRRAESADETRRILAALADLPEKERAAVVLRDLQGLPTSEVAEILGSSPVTVRTQISRARLKLHRFRQQMHRRES